MNQRVEHEISIYLYLHVQTRFQQRKRDYKLCSHLGRKLKHETYFNFVFSYEKFPSFRFITATII